LTVSGIVASVIGGALSDRFAQRWGVRARVALLLGCYLLALVGAMLILLAQTGPQAALAFAIWALGSVSGYVIGHVVMQEGVPNEMRATTVALSLAITALVGIGLGPTLVPLVAEQAFGGALQPAMGAISLGAALLALVVIWRPAYARIVDLKRGP
jgi:MFS family permease